MNEPASVIDVFLRLDMTLATTLASVSPSFEPIVASETIASRPGWLVLAFLEADGKGSIAGSVIDSASSSIQPASVDYWPVSSRA